MTITRVGANQKYASGWESAFGSKKTSTKKQATAEKPGATESKKPAVKAKKKSAPKKSSK